MNRLLVAISSAMLVFPLTVHAQERAGDAALGALSGAVVLGPVGAVAGAVVGFTAGPSISRSWGLHRSGGRRHVSKVRGSRSKVAGRDDAFEPRNSSTASTAQREAPPRQPANGAITTPAQIP